MSTELDEVKYEVAVANRILSALGLATGLRASLGHVSLRLPSQPDRFVVKGRGYDIDALAAMRPQDMVVCDLEGYKVDGPLGSYQAHEVKLHSCILKTYPEVQSVVHVHPQYAILASGLGKTLVPMCQEGIRLVRNPLPVYPHTKIITTEEEGMEVATLLGDSKAILLKGHGAATVGQSLEESVMNMLQLEEQAKMNWYAYCAAGPDHPKISDELVEEALDLRGLAELPHLKDAIAQRGGIPPRVGGAWPYFQSLVTQDM